MKTGRRVANPDLKKLSGTYRGDRHGAIVELVMPARSIPIVPGYLSKAAQAI